VWTTGAQPPDSAAGAGQRTATGVREQWLRLSEEIGEHGCDLFSLCLLLGTLSRTPRFLLGCIRQPNLARYADGVSGDWYVRGTRGDRFGLMLGPFDNEDGAEARIDDVREKLRELIDSGEIGPSMADDYARFDVCRLEPDEANPLGQMNARGYLTL